MIVQVFGARGSEPVSSPNKIKYGGNTTCVRITSGRMSEDSLLVVDLGTGLRALTEHLSSYGAVKNVNVLFTHYHNDHRNGVGCSALMHDKSVTKYLFGPDDDGYSPMSAIAQEFEKPRLPVTVEKIKSSFEEIVPHEEEGLNSTDYVLCFYQDLRRTIPFSEYEELLLNSAGQVGFERDGTELRVGLEQVLFVKNIEVAHPDKCISYRFEEYVIKNEAVELESCFVFLTDCEAQMALPALYRDHLSNANLAIVDCQYNMKDYQKYSGYGHGNPYWVAEIAEKAGLREIGITHYDPGATDVDIDSLVSECKYQVESRGLRRVKVFGVQEFAEYAI